MNYEQAEKASIVLADVVESIAEVLEVELQLESLAKSLRQRAQEVRDDRFTVLVVGEFKRGKSTLLNAMMGNNVLPQKVAPCTAVVTIITYGEEKDVHIVFATKQGEELPIDEIITIEEFRTRFALKAEDAADDGVFDNTGFDRFSGIQYARILYPVELCRHRVELVDSPGLGEHRIRSQRTERFLDRADAVVMVLDATQLLREEELHFLDHVLLPRGLNNIFFTINKWNLIKDQVLMPDEEEANYHELNARIGEKLGPYCVIDSVDRADTRIFRINALGALKIRMNGGADLKEIESTGLPTFERALQTFLVEDRGRARRDLVMAQLRNALNSVHRHIENQLVLAEKSIKQIELERLAIAPRLMRLRDIRAEADEYLRETSTNLQGRLVLSFRDHVMKMDQDIPNAVADFGLGALTKNSLWKLITDWTKDDDQKFAKQLERHLKPRVERYFERKLSEWQMFINEGEMGGIADRIEKRLAHYAEKYRCVLKEIEDQIGVENSVLPEVKSLVESWLGVNSHRLSGQGSFLADTKLALGMLADLAPLFATIAADLAMDFVGVAVPGIGLIVTGWRLYVREQHIQEDMVEKIVAEMRKQLHQVENTHATTIREKVSEGFDSLRTRIIDKITQDIDSIDLSLQDIIARKQAKEYSAETDKQRMRDARDSIVDEIQALDTADLTHVEKAMARIKHVRRQRRSDPSAAGLGTQSESLSQDYRIETIAEFSAGLQGMILALESAHDEMNRLEIGRPLSLPRLAETIARLKEQQARGLRVAVFGSFSSGKSSLINALLGIDHLVVGTQATTASLTHIRKSTTSVETAVVHYKSVANFVTEVWTEVKSYHADLIVAAGDECENILGAFDSLAVHFSDPADTSVTMSPSWLAQTLLPAVREYFVKTSQSGISIPPERRADWGMTSAFIKLASELAPNTLAHLGKQETLTLSELKPVLAEEQTAVCVEQVELCLNTALLEGDLEIVDTPGLGSLHARHTRQSEAFVKDVDAILYVLPDRGPGKDDVEFIALLDRRNEVLGEDKVFFAANMVDKAIDEDAQCDASMLIVEQRIAQHTNWIREDLKNRGFVSARVFSVSAKAALYARSASIGDLTRKEQHAYRKVALWVGETEQPDPEENLRLSGVPSLSEALERFLIGNGVRLRINQSRARVVAVLDKIANQESARLHLLSREREQLEVMHRELIEVQQRINDGSNSERSDTEREVGSILSDHGKTPMRRELMIVLEGIVEPIANKWMKERKDFAIIGKAFGHFGTKILNLFCKKEEEEKSSLQLLIEKMVEEAVIETVKKNQIIEKMESLQKDISCKLAQLMLSRLNRISGELDRIRINDDVRVSYEKIHFQSVASCDDVFLSDIEENVGGIIMGAAMVGAGFAMADWILFAGLGTIIAAIVSGVYAVLKKWDWFRVPDDLSKERNSLAEKLREQINARSEEFLKKAVDEKLDGVGREIMKVYDKEVNGMIMRLADEIMRAKSDIDLKRDQRDSLMREHKQVQQVLASLRGRIDTLLPEIA